MRRSASSPRDIIRQTSRHIERGQAKPARALIIAVAALVTLLAALMIIHLLPERAMKIH